MILLGESFELFFNLASFCHGVEFSSISQVCNILRRYSAGMLISWWADFAAGHQDEISTDPPFFNWIVLIQRKMSTLSSF